MAPQRRIEATQSAARTGSHATLAGVGFLVVFREGVETVLFYQGLAYGAPGEGHLIWMGFGLGTDRKSTRLNSSH